MCYLALFFSLDHTFFYLHKLKKGQENVNENETRGEKINNLLMHLAPLYMVAVILHKMVENNSTWNCILMVEPDLFKTSE